MRHFAWLLKLVPTVEIMKKRRAFVRFFACKQDLSHEPPDAVLPAEVVTGAEPFMVVGAMAGG